MKASSDAPVEDCELESQSRATEEVGGKREGVGWGAAISFIITASKLVCLV